MRSFMKPREIFAKTVLTRTGIPGYDYCINPYVGCAHGCKYCYASFMKRFTGHPEPWGEFVDVKVNAPQVLKRQLKRAARGSVLVGTVTDPYQPAEKAHAITRGCLEALLERQFPTHLLTRSPLCLRDMDLFKQFEEIEVGLSITTDSEETKRLFEARSPSIQSRIDALAALHAAGIRNYAFIGPLLPSGPGPPLREARRHCGRSARRPTQLPEQSEGAVPAGRTRAISGAGLSFAKPLLT